MRFIVQVRIEPDDHHSVAIDDDGLEPTVVEIAVVERGELSSATLGLSIVEEEVPSFVEVRW